MPNWNDLVMQVRYTDARALARLASEMWSAAAQFGDNALLSNLQMNVLDTVGVAMALDWANVPVPERLVLPEAHNWPGRAYTSVQIG